MTGPRTETASVPASSFHCFATCKVGAQSAFKKEIANLHPDWHPAFMRPGFVSFKVPAALDPGFTLDSMFALTHAVSLGTARMDDAVARVAGVLPEISGNSVPKLHCWARSTSETRESPNPLDPLARALESSLRQSGAFQPETRAGAGDLVVDVMVVDAGMVVIGWHRHHPGHSPFPGGHPPLVLPADAPSRAWMKFEEALLWHPKPIVAGQIAVEIGSAPGGTAHALIARGAKVISIDPAAMDPRLDLHHIRKLAGGVEPADLPPSFDWLLIDINDNPGSTIRLATRFIGLSRKRPSLILTLKTSDWMDFEHVPDYRRRLARLGYRDIRARQLFHGRREIVLLA